MPREETLNIRYMRSLPEWDKLPVNGYLVAYDPTAPAGQRFGKLPYSAFVGGVGPPGPPGEQGPQGDRGPPGYQGAAGLTGLTGTQGPTGEQGSKGLQGDKGMTGDKGPPGDKGPTGDAGPASIIVPVGGKDGDVLVKKGSTLIWKSPTVSIWLG